MSSESDSWSDLFPESEGSPGESPSVEATDEGRRDDEPELFAPGDIVDGRYRVARTIAHGGMGVVFEVHDQQLDLRLALKAVKPHIARQTQTLGRFRREVRLSGRVAHPNVCRLYGAGLHQADGFEIHFLTMELLEGETLGARLRRDGPTPPEEAEVIVRQMVSGLAAAHDLGIVHRDLKPSNIILVPGDRGVRAVITDFGLSRCLISEEETSRLTATGQLMGTPAYFAPELLEGHRLAPASDIYSLGVVVFEMLSGELPFTGRSPFVVALRRLNEPPRSILDLVPSLDRRWVNWLSHCLQRQSEDRLEDGRAALQMFDSGDLPTPRVSAFGTPSPGPASPMVATTDRQVSEETPSVRGGLLLGALVALAVLILLAIFFVLRAAPPEEPGPLRLVIAPPLVMASADEPGSTTADPSPSELLAFELEFALRRGASPLEDVRLIDRTTSHSVGGQIGDLGRATAADAVVTSRLETADGQWRILLQRVEIPSLRVAWQHELAVPEAAPRLLVHAIDEAMARGFSELRRRPTEGALALDSHQYQERVRLSRRLTETSGPNPPHISEPETTKILADLESLRRQASDDLEIHLLEARWTLAMARRIGGELVPRAQLAVERARSLAPDHPRPLELAIELAILLRDFDRGWRELALLRRLTPGDCVNDLWASRLSAAAGQPDSAAGALRRVVDRCPAWDLLAELASAEERLGHLPQARRALAEAFELAPNVESLRERLEDLGPLPTEPDGEAVPR